MPRTRAEKKPRWLREVADPHELLEKEVYEMVHNLYLVVHCLVIRHSQPFKAAQTKGLWDLECYYRVPIGDPAGEPWRPMAHLFVDAEGQRWEVFHWGHELKRWKKTASPIQEEFHAKTSLVGVPTIVGGLNTAIDFLATHGIAHFEPRPGHW